MTTDDKMLKSHSVLVVRPDLTGMIESSEEKKIPKDLILWRSDLPSGKALQAYRDMVITQNSFYDLVVPADLQGVDAGRRREILRSFLGLRMLGFYLERFLEKRLSSAGLTLSADQAFQHLSSLRCICIDTPKGARMYHTPISDTQGAILRAVDLRSHVHIGR